MAIETFHDVMRRQGITCRSFNKFCSLTAVALGLKPAHAQDIRHAMETKPRFAEATEKYDGNFILAVEGNPPLSQEGMSYIIGGRPFLEQLKHAADHCKAIISWGSCASWGCVQAARPNPTQATPVHKVPGLVDKPIIEESDDEGARKGYCPYEVGGKEPTTCIGCSEDGFWDKGSFYERLSDSASRPTRSAVPPRPRWAQA